MTFAPIPGASCLAGRSLDSGRHTGEFRDHGARAVCVEKGGTRAVSQRSQIVIPTGACHSRREWQVQWRDLMFLLGYAMLSTVRELRCQLAELARVDELCHDFCRRFTSM